MTEPTEVTASELMNDLRDSVRKAIGGLASPSWQMSYPAIDIYETDDSLIVQTEPIDGLDKHSVEVTIVGHDITISGQTTPQTQITAEAFIVRERQFGTFSRTLTLPLAVKPEAAKARIKRQQITVQLPRMGADENEVISIQLAD